MSATLLAVLVARLATEMELAQMHLREAEKLAKQIQEAG